jgi:hypothetical protein
VTDHVSARPCVLFRIGRSVPPSLGLGLVATLLLSIVSWEAQAQEGPPGRLTGRVVDASSGDPLPAATVALWTRADGDSTLVTGMVTGLKGRFEITDAPSQSYVLRISYVGYQTLRRANTRPTCGWPAVGT